MSLLERLKSASAADHARAIFLLIFGTILGAWIFEYFGIAPCDLCLKQRIAYYVGVPLAALTFLVLKTAPRFANVFFWALALVFVGSAIFGAYHSGVEWGFWPGPEGCTGALKPAASTDDFLKALANTKVVRCDAVAIRIFGLSLAGWNAVISAFVVWLSARATTRV